MKLRTIWQVGTSLLRNVKIKLLRGKAYRCHWLYSMPVSAELRLHKGGRLTIGRHLSAQRDVLVSACPGAELSMGNNVNLNESCSIVARRKITIGDDVLFGPNVKVYDHDHDYHKLGQERKTSFVTGEIQIGSGVWIGANCVILKNTKIGDNCVFGAGTIIKGEYPANTLVVQERTEKRKTIDI